MKTLARIAAGTIGPLALAGAALPVSAQSIAPLPAAASVQAPEARDTVAADAETPDLIHLGQDANSRMTVPVHIGDVGPFSFMVDTGAQRTVLTHQTADRLGLVPNGQVRLVSVAGVKEVSLVSVAELTMGTRRFVGLVAPVVDGHELGAEGIVGLDGLQDQRVDIDFARRRMLIGQSPPDATSDSDFTGDFGLVVKARRRSGQLIMTEALIDGVRVDVMIDTGADNSIGNLALQKALNLRRTSESADLVAVTGQTITAAIGRAKSMQIGGMRINNLMFAYADAPAFAYLKLNHRPALMLGMRDLSAFRRIAIDFARRRVMFNFGAKPETLAAR